MGAVNFCLLIMWDECVNSILAAATPIRKTNRRAAFIQTKRAFSLVVGFYCSGGGFLVLCEAPIIYEDSFLIFSKLHYGRHRSGQGLKRDKHSIIKFTETYKKNKVAAHSQINIVASCNHNNITY